MVIWYPCLADHTLTLTPVPGDLIPLVSAQTCTHTHTLFFLYGGGGKVLNSSFSSSVLCSRSVIPAPEKAEAGNSKAA